jgi:succinyl-diaminopimelate desuccinylase
MPSTALKERLLREVETRSSEVVRLASDLIRIPSENPPGNLGDITSFVEKYLRSMSIDVSLIEEAKGWPNLLCETGPESPQSLLLNGHLDVVPVGSRSGWLFNPFSGDTKDGYIHGRGASDMKGGVAGILFAFALLHRERKDLKGRLKLQLVPDEETGGAHGTRWLADSGRCHSTAAIVAEPTGLDTIDVGQKGIFWLRIETQGIPAHGSLGPYVGDNAITKTAALITELRSIMNMTANPPADIRPVIVSSKRVAEQLIGKKGIGRVLQTPSLNIGLISGGTKVNMVPDRCTTDIDIRLPIGLQAEKVLKKARTIADKYDGKVTVISESAPNYTSPNQEIVKALSRNVHEVTSRKPKIFVQWATSDARYLRAKGIPTAHYGPAHLEGIHGFNEKVKAGDVVAAAKVYVGTAIDYLT